MKNENETEAGKVVDEITEPVINTGDEPGVVNNNDNGASHILPEALSEESANIPAEETLSHHEDEFEETSEEVADEVTAVDFAHLSKKELTTHLQTLVSDNDHRKVDKELRVIKPLHDELRARERGEALARFKTGGGIEEDFEFKGDEDDALFDATFRLIRDKKNQYYKGLEEQKTTNLKRKEEILEKLRALAESEDTEHSFQAFKQLQNEWKSIGPVAPAQIKTLWANYGALVDRFYDQRSIHFELKELDRRKNLVLKTELCEKAEKLAGTDRIQQAVRELNDLHNEFKHVGPVPKEDKEALWTRFKTASDAVYAKRDIYITQLTGELQKNLEAKLALGEELAAFGSFQSDRIKEWNQKTQEILALQKRWEAAGAVPRSKSKDINKKFWAAFKGFFSNKNQFFKKLDEGRDKNLKLKQEIIQKANELKESTDWDKTANDLKDLQTQWKEIGPVQDKFREKIFQEFKAACDHFFEQRRSQFEKADLEQEEVLKQKEAVCAELETLATEKTGSLDKLNELQSRFNALGFVPKRAVSGIKNRFNEAVNKLVATLDIPNNDKEKALLGIQINGMKNDPQAEVKIYHKEQAIRKRIQKMENDISTLRNNLEFFGRSKNADKMKEEFNNQIATATEELAQLKNQLKMIKTATA